MKNVISCGSAKKNVLALIYTFSTLFLLGIFQNSNTNMNVDGLNMALTALYIFAQCVVFGLHASNFDNICDLYVSVIIFGFIELVARVRSWCTVDI